MRVFHSVSLQLVRRRRQRERQARFLRDVALGAGLMFLLDRDRGARRRALLRDKTAHGLRRIGELVQKGTRDLEHRIRGAYAELHAGAHGVEVLDPVLVDRVRSKMGRCASHVHALEVSAHEGKVTLRGPILAREVRGLLATVAAVPGVKSIVNELEVHESERDVPALQGASHAAEARAASLEKSWAPSTRLIGALLGATLAVHGVRRGDRRGALLGAAGAALLLRDLTNRPLSHLLGVGAERHAVSFQKTIHVWAPVEEVFQIWTNFEQFPRFMSHLLEVKNLGDDRYHWTAVGPLGIPVRWDAVVTQRIPEQLVAWKSVPGAAIGNEGSVHFTPTPDGGTQLDIRLAYSPPGGAIGHAVASLFGVDPKHAMDEDLVRFQSLFDHGKTTAHGEQVRIDELTSQT